MPQDDKRSVASATPALDFTPVTLAPGSVVLNRYDVIATIGRGPSAIVYRVKDRADGSELALKLMPPRLSFDRELLLRLVRELRTATEIFHPNFVNIRAAEEWNGALVIVMELVPGRSLKDEIEKQGPLPRGRALKVMHDAASAVRALQRENVTHRNVWPRNVLFLKDGTVKVMDFAGARARAIMGKTGIAESAAYLSPEECDPRLHGDARSDVYNLGTMLHELLTGRCPFPPSISSLDVKDHHRPDPGPLPADTPEWVTSMIGKSLSLMPRDRQASTEDFVREIEATATEQKVASEIDDLMEDVERKKKARAAAEAAMRKEPPPPLVLPEPEIKRKAAVRTADFSTAEILKKNRKGLQVGAIFAGALFLAVVLAVVTRPRSAPPAAPEDTSQREKVSVAEKVKLHLDGFKDGFPGDDEGNLTDLVALGPQALPTIEQAVGDPDPLVRSYVARALGGIDAEGSREQLEKLARDPESRVRESALSALSHVKTIVSPEVGTAALGSRSVPEQKLGLALVSSGLCRVGTDAVIPLTTSSDDGVRSLSLQALAKLGGADVPAILKKMLSDPNAKIRLEAARGLGEFAGDETAAALAPVLSDVSPEVARAAAFSFAGSLSPVQKQRMAPEALKSIGKQEAAFTVVALLRAKVEGIEPALLEGLKSKDPAARAYAAQVLMLADDRNAAKALDDALQSLSAPGSRLTRWSQRPFLVALATLDSEPHFKRIADALSSESRERAIFAANALADVGNPAAVPALQKVAGTLTSQETAIPFVAAMARLGTMDRQYRELIQSESPEGRAMAARIFGLARDTSMTGTFVEMRNKEQDHELAFPFDVALGRLWHRPTIDAFRQLALTGDPVSRQRAARFFTELGRPEFVSNVLPLVSDARPEVRAQAVLALGAMGDARVLTSVRPLAGDGDPAVRLAAASALYRLGDEQILDVVSAELKSPKPEKRAEACRKLALMGSPLATEALLPVLSDTARYGPAVRKNLTPGEPQPMGKGEYYPRVLDEAVQALTVITGYRCGYDVWAVDEDQNLALEKLKGYVSSHLAEIKASELL